MIDVIPTFGRPRLFGELATTSGVWVCVGCYQHRVALAAGEAFPRCPSCQSPLGWEPVRDHEATAEPDDARPWCGVFGDLPAAGPVTLPAETALPPARPTTPNLSWLPDRGGRDE